MRNKQTITVHSSSWIIPPEFVFLSERTYSCQNLSHQVREYEHKYTAMSFMLIPGGSFLMGSPPEELGRKEEEILHQVNLTPYLIAKTPCTQKQWSQIKEQNPSEFLGEELPVQKIYWTDASQFAEEVSLELPTEAQWEFACRASSSSMYYFGDDPCLLEEYAWFGMKGGYGPRPVAQKKNNAFGLHDMHGNTWEWCQDSCFFDAEKIVVDSYHDGILNPASQKGDGKIFRGGSWLDSPEDCRSAAHYGLMPSYRSGTFSVRFAKSLIQNI